ncbi:MAG: RimK family alpha-L-glutamate ligase [Nitrospinae bacterium]|nr:RimK family alpha-L-glutamate ligase [Nitrospinota bacterium]MDA1108676.1 RimK family alpha-L-glutamate ligase [Nitrospinota bacterium]
MAKIGIYVERNTISKGDQMAAIMRFSHHAQRMGHRADFLFRADMFKIPEYDGLYIRAFTDPLNSAYVAARTAQMHGIRVLDDPDSILICCDKVNMYRHLMNRSVPIPETLFLDETQLTLSYAQTVFEQLGNPVVLKATNGSFSMYVEKVENAEEFVKVGKNYFRRADRIVAQRFVRSEFDWRVGVLGGEPLYVCQYSIPKKHWKVATYQPDGKTICGPVKAMNIDKVDPHLLEVAKKAAAAIGNGLYGVDLKQVGQEYVVVEVNDNPTINAGVEDSQAPDLYERLIRYFVE